MNIAIIAVNCFVFISGYFRIKVKVKGLLSLFLQIFFYSFLFTLVSYLLQFNVDIVVCVKRCLFPLTDSGMWFITAYIALYLFSPLINAGYANLNSKERKIMLFFLLLVDVYIGYMHQSSEVSIDGYHLVHFIVLYYIGAYISDLQKEYDSLKLFLFWIFIVFVMTLMHSIKMVFFPISIVYSLRYNSPMVMLASVVFFMWIRTLKIRSQLINTVSVSVLSVYIIQSQPIVDKYLWSFCKMLSDKYESFSEFFFILISLLLFYVLCVSFDKIRILICSPCVNRLSSTFENGFIKSIK